MGKPCRRFAILQLFRFLVLIVSLYEYYVILGRQLKLEGDNFRQKLNTQHIFDDWVARVQAKNISLTGRIFIIEKRQKDGKIALNLKVNFSSDVVTLFKEVTLLVETLNFWKGSIMNAKMCCNVQI